MTVAFVVDTSASMNQRCANGLSLLDCAKSAVEHFVKMRFRDTQWHRGDRYLLVTCEEGPNAIKVIDRFPYTNFTRALKSIEAHDLTEISASLQQVLDYLHLQRLANDVDKYGQGRNPLSIEPTTILLLTDGTELCSKSGVLKTIAPSGPLPLGGELSAKPFRWDQRVFAILLRIPSVSQQVLERSGPLPQNAPISGHQTAVAIDSDIFSFCESTGGKCYVATSWKILMQHIEVTSRLSTSVVVSFENIPIPGAPPPQVHAACLRKLLFIRGNQHGHWPIPEAYWPDPSQQSLPPRDPHPMIAYRAIDSDPFIPHQFVFDKYDIEPNPIINFLGKANPGVCWQVFIRNSKGPNFGYGDPFGYVRAFTNTSTNTPTLSLFVLPYNYPALWHLLDQAAKIPKLTSLPQWRQDMERYCNGIPSYYGPPLKQALRHCGLTQVVPDSLEKSLVSGFVGNQLKRLKAQAKTEWENLTDKVINANVSCVKSQERVFPFLAAATGTPAPHLFPSTSFSVRLASSPSITSGESVLSQKIVEVLIPSGPSPSFSCTKINPSASEPSKSGNESHSGAVSSKAGSFTDTALFKNPFDVPRNELLSQLKYLPIRVALAMDARAKSKGILGKRSNLGSLAARIVAKEEEEARHTVPIEKMGDFSDALWKQQPPRNPFADDQERNKQQRSLFGNPYRQEKNDGADEAWLEGSGGPQCRGRKRRRRPGSPSPASSSSGATTSSSASTGECSSDVSSGNNEVNSPPSQDDKKADNRDATATATASSDSPADSGASGQGIPTVEEAETISSSETRNHRHAKLEAAREEIKRGSEFVLTAIRALRHAKPNKTEKLFELLSAADVVPVDKPRLLDQLIHEANCYKKTVVATELADYRNKFLASQTG